MENSVEQQDARGWTPIMWSCCNGYPKLVRQLIQQGANVGHFGQARNGVGTTSALHECAAMSGEKGQSADAYYECAWLLMVAGQSPFKERSDGCTAIDVAARFGQKGMKSFLEGCALYRGNLMMSIPVTFGTKLKMRYCIVHPRFPFTNAAPSLWMTCFRSPSEIQPVCVLPIGNARVVIEGAQDSGSGIMIIPNSSKLPKTVAIRSHTQNSSIVEITACAAAGMPAWKNLRTLADVCKAAGVAISCHSLDQLCAAALRSAVRQMQLPGSNAKLQMSEADLPSKSSDGAQNQAMESIKEEPQIADSAQEMAEQTPKPAAPTPPQTEVEPARLSNASQASRRSSGIGRMFRSAFRLSSSSKPKYSSQLLDSSSSLGQISVASTAEPQKKGLFGMKKSSSSSSKSKLQSMPSINENQGAPIQQHIPDKFWSKMGRKMSSQNSTRPMTSRENIESWFHEDDGIVSHPNAIAQQKGNQAAQDLNELMFPSMAKDTPESAAAQPSLSPEKLRRQTSDGARFKSSQGGPISFVLEEPIVPTTPMVPSGPRRSFSFDDLDDFMSGNSRKARGHREGYTDQFSPSEPKAVLSGTTQKPGPANRVPAGSPKTLPNFAMRAQSMPRRSFSFQGLDQLLSATEAQNQALAQAASAPRSTIDEDLQAWQRLREQRGVEAKKGPMIDPASYGGFQGAYAPEWRQYTPPSARPVPQPQPLKPVQPQRSSENLQMPGAGSPMQPGSRSHSLGHNQAQAGGTGATPGLSRQPSRKASQPLSPRQGLPQVRSMTPGQTGNAVANALNRQGSTPRQGWVSPAMQSAQRHALESQLQQQRKSAGSAGGSLGARPQSASHHPTPAVAQAPKPQLASRQSQGAEKKANKSLEEFLIGPELANLAALRALETGTLSSGSPRRSDTGASQTASAEILGSQPVTKSEKRRISKDRVERNVTHSSTSQPARRSKDLLGSGSQPGSAPVTPRQPHRKSQQAPVLSSGGSNTASLEGVIRTRSGRTPAERRSQNQNSENVAASRPQEAVEYEQPAVTMPVSPEAPQTAGLNKKNLDIKAQEEQEISPAKADVRRSSATSASSMSQAVPSALFHGVKAPKFSTPPKRIAPEGEVVPDIPEHRSSKDQESTPERPSVGFGA